VAAASRIAIVGGGVAGCAATALLARPGRELTLFEAVDDPRPVGAGVLLQPTGQQVLDRLGLLADARAHGATIDGLFGDTASGRPVLDMSYRRFAPDCFGIGIQRGTLHGLLWRRVRQAGATLRLGTPVGTWTQDAHGVALHDTRGRPLGHFDALVLANGSFSTLRQAMRVRQSQAAFAWGALWAVLPAPPGAAPALLRQRFRAAREMVGLMPVGRALGEAPGAPAGVNFYWSLPLDRVPAWQAAPLEPWKRHVAELLPESAPLLEAVSTHEQLRVARYADVAMAQWHDGRVVAIGDCGHGMSPQLGQGANMALIDAFVLAHCARRSSDWPAVFAHYSRERHAHLRFYQRASVALTPLFQSHRRLGPALRDLFFGLPGRLPWVHDQSIAALSGLKTGWLSGRLDLARYDLPPATP
jgi:2-polyprenyl-6-methoxyphenol hydroxylase-like FAD-dependent oxidoreductase